MRRSSAEEISTLLHAWHGGDQTALDKLMPLVYDELRRLAHRYMLQERPDHILQTTDLVNEAYLRLINAREVQWNDRVHFFAISAGLMRRILVDFARSRGYQKRGGNRQMLSLKEELWISHTPDPDLVKLDDALTALSAFDPRKAKVVELRFFGGMSLAETAETLGISPETVKRDWRMARTWLLCELRDRGRNEP